MKKRNSEQPEEDHPLFPIDALPLFRRYLSGLRSEDVSGEELESQVSSYGRWRERIQNLGSELTTRREEYLAEYGSETLQKAGELLPAILRSLAIGSFATRLEIKDRQQRQ